MPNRQAKIAVVDDDASVSEAIKTLLRAAGFQVTAYPSGEAFLQSGASSEAACLILDVHLPGLSGIELNQEIIRSGRNLPVVFITANDDLRTREKCESARAIAYFTKPFSGR